MQAFSADFRPSVWQRTACVLLAAAAFYCATAYFSGSLNMMLTAATACSLYFAFKRPKYWVERLEIDPNGEAVVFVNHACYKARLLSGSLITPFLCLLHWQTEDFHCYQYLFPDSAPQDVLRRIRVWAWWQQPS